MHVSLYKESDLIIVYTHVCMYMVSFLLGILNAVSYLLLVFDQSEVRKLVKQCEGIIEYLQVKGERGGEGRERG